MSAAFSRLPVHIKEQVAQKLKFDALIDLCQSCPAAASDLKRAHIDIPDDVHKVEIKFLNKEIYVRFLPKHFKAGIRWINASDLPAIQFVGKLVCIKDDLHESHCEALTAFFHRIGAQNTRLELSYRGNNNDWFCTANAFTELLKAADVKELRRGREIDANCLCDLPEKVSKINVYSAVVDYVLEKIRVPDLEISGSFIGSSGLNDLLKEWSEGTRRIERISVKTMMDLNAERILDGIEFEETDEPDLFILEKGEQRFYCLIDSQVGYFAVNTDGEKI